MFGFNFRLPDPGGRADRPPKYIQLVATPTAVYDPFLWRATGLRRRATPTAVEPTALQNTFNSSPIPITTESRVKRLYAAIPPNDTPILF